MLGTTEMKTRNQEDRAGLLRRVAAKAPTRLATLSVAALVGTLAACGAADDSTATPNPITWAAAVCSVGDDGSEAARNFQVGCAMQSDPANNVEHLDVPTSFAAVADIASLGAVPMIVATAADHPFAGLAATETARLNDVWNAGQQHWMSLSSNSQLVAIDDTSHDIQLDQPGAVMDQIRELLP